MDLISVALDSLHACFTRELKAGAHRVHADAAVLASSCDATVGACGVVQQGNVLQAKGFPYRLLDRLGLAERAAVAEEHIHTLAVGRMLWVRHGDQFDGVIQCAKWLACVGD